MSQTTTEPTSLAGRKVLFVLAAIEGHATPL